MRKSVDYEIDVSGMNCPVHVLSVIDVLNKLATGQVVKIRASDPQLKRDFELLCNDRGDKLLESIEQNGEYIYYIQKCQT